MVNTLKLCLFILAVASIQAKEDVKWPDGIIHYQYHHSSVTEKLKNTIRQAMDIWEAVTCLEFKEKNSLTDASDYIMFHNRPNEEYCTCNSIGRKGGQQDIALGFSCQAVGDLLHTLGHIVGLHDEQNRPDRDDYVTVLRDNIELGYEEKFATFNDLSVGYLGVGYDYASVMHLNNAAYAKRGLATIEVCNEVEYAEQGSPKLGDRQRLSEGDKLKVNRLYKCPRLGKCEKLIVTVGGIQQLQTNNGISHRVDLVAVNENGESETLSTRNIVYDGVEEGDFNPVWNQRMEFQVTTTKWQFFHLKVIGNKYEEKILSMVETIPLEIGPFSSSSVADPTQVSFTYECIKDADDCRLCNRQNRRSCSDGLFDYTCDCSAGYEGKSCDTYLCAASLRYCNTNGGLCIPYYYSDPGTPNYKCSCPLAWSPASQCHEWEARCLRITVKHASGLDDEDGFWAGNSDPYATIRAYTTSGGSSNEGRTSKQQGTHHPRWNYRFNPGCGLKWNRFYFKVYDEDVIWDDSLSSGQYVYLTDLDTLPKIDYTVKLVGGGGTITFDIFYE